MIFEWTSTFFGKIVVYVSCPYGDEPSCKKLTKSLVAFPRKSQKTSITLIEWSNFDLKYLENENFFWQTVFAGWKTLLRATFPEKMVKIVSSVSEIISKNLWKWYIFVIFEWSGIFSEKPPSAFFCPYRVEHSCKKSEKSLPRFLRKFAN